MPFSFTYVGLILGLAALAARAKPVAVTLAAGVPMFLGVVGSCTGLAAMDFAAGAPGACVVVDLAVKSQWGLGLALIMSLLYTALGTYAARRMK